MTETQQPLQPETSPSFPGWRVLLGAVLGMAFSPGPMIFGSLGLFTPFFQHDFGWNTGAIMLSLTFFNISGVLAAPWTGMMIDRHGVRKILFPSLLALAIGFPLIALSTISLTVFYIFAFLWGAVTVGTQSISYTKLITGWFVKHRGLAVGITAAGLGLGYSIVPLMVGFLLSLTDWHMTLILMGMVVIFIPLLANFLLAKPNPTPAAHTTSSNGMTLQEARKTSSFWYMAGGIFLASTALTGVVPHISLMVLDHGFDKSNAAIVASTYGLSTILGRVLVGSLADRFFVPHVAMFFFGMSTIGFVLAAGTGGTSSLPVLILIALTIGFGFGAESDVIALFISRYFGQRAFSAIYGYLLSIFLIGASLGPPLFGFGRDKMGSYSVPMIIAAAIMGAACLLLSRLPRYPSDQTSESSPLSTKWQAGT